MAESGIVEFKIYEHIVVLERYGSGWSLEANIVGWNGGETCKASEPENKVQTYDSRQRHDGKIDFIDIRNSGIECDIIKYAAVHNR